MYLKCLLQDFGHIAKASNSRNGQKMITIKFASYQYYHSIYFDHYAKPQDENMPANTQPNKFIHRVTVVTCELIS